MNTYILKRSDKKDKKYLIITPDKKKIYFGSSRYDDYTKHHDISRKTKYILRHRKNEDWTINGINTAGFWSRWLLWESTSILEAINNIENIFGINIRFNRF